jgi:outer membrane immunogenic protein
MKKILLITSAIGALSCGAANAADLQPRMVTKAPPASVMSWAGFYIGAHGGWGSGQFTGSVVQGSGYGALDFPVHGAVAGGQVGYNWQFGRAVHGVELDASWTNIKGSDADLFSNTNHEFKTDFLGSLRYRGGVAVDNVLIYSTIGIGYGRSKYTNTGAVPSPASQDLNAFALVSGFGAEWALDSNWSVRGEYLYYYFGKEQNLATLTNVSNASDFARLDGIHVARVAANYRFGGTGVAQAAGPNTNWAGPYIGAHGGYGLSRITGGYDEFGGQPTGPFAINPRGFVGGGQLGYNWQSGVWVYGVEVDGTWGAMSKSRIDGEGDTEELKTDVLASARLRWGATAGDKLYYLTGGLGYARSKLTVTGGDTPSPATATLSSWGAVVGAGVDWAFAPNWSARLESLTYLFNNRTDITALTNDSDPADKLRQSMISVTRVGVNYRW